MVKADPKAIAARQGKTHLDQKKAHRRKLEEKRGEEWRKTHSYYGLIF